MMQSLRGSKYAESLARNSQLLANAARGAKTTPEEFLREKRRNLVSTYDPVSSESFAASFMRDAGCLSTSTGMGGFGNRVEKPLVIGTLCRAFLDFFFKVYAEVLSSVDDIPRA